MFNKPGSKLIFTALLCEVLKLIIHLSLYLGQDIVFEISNIPGSAISGGHVWNIPETVGIVLGVVLAGTILFAVISAKNMKSAFTASVAGLVCRILLSLIIMIAGKAYYMIASRSGADTISALATVSSYESMLTYIPAVISSICFAAAAGRLSWHKDLDPADAPYPVYRD